MAGSVGTIFAEIDLDSSRYLKSQQKLLQDAKSTTLNIEQNFKNLGVKSSAEFDLMRQKITNSYEMIKNSSQATANDIVRAEQAKNNQLNSINEQQFGKQTSLMDKIKTNWFSIATTATAVYATITQFAVPAIKAYMDQENAIVKMGMAMKNQGDFSADALKEMEDYSEQIQDTTTYADELTLSVMANLKSYGMTNDEVKKATRVAQDFTSAKKQEGMTITTASDLLGKAYVGNTGALGRYGVVIDQTLQGSEKFEAVMGQLEQRFGGSAQAELLTYSGQWEHLKNQWGDIQELLGFALLKSIQALQVGVGLLATTFLSAGEIILSVFDSIITPITFILEQFAALADYAGMEDLAFGLRSVANATSEAKDSITATKEEVMGWTSKQYDALVATDSTTKSIEKMGIQGQKTGAIDKEAAAAAEKAAKDRERAIVELTKAIAKSQGEIDSRYMTAHEKELARIEREAEEWLKKTQDDVLVAEWKAGQIAIANQKQEDETFKMWRKASEDAEAAMKAEADMGVKMTDDTIKRGDERRKAEIEIYKDLRGYETENYNATLELIKKKETDLRALGVSEIAIAAWVTEETRKAELKKAEYSDSFFEGVRAGLADITAKQTSWGKVGIDTVKSFSDNASKTMGSVFFDAYKGQLKSSTEYFTAFSDALVKTFTDALAKMIVDAALSKITMSFNATWTEGAGAVLGAVGKVLGYAADWFFGDMVPDAGQAYGGLMGGLNPGADSYANDTIPAMLSPGEYVMPRSAVNQETVGTLEYMRQTGQKPQGYYDGGMVYGNDAYLQDYERQQEELRIAAMQQAQDEEAIRGMALYTGSYDSASTLFYEMRQAEAERIQAEQQAQQQLEHNNYLAYLARVQAAHIAKLDTYAPVIDEESYTQLYTTIPNILSQDIYSGPPMAAMEYLGTKNGLNVYGVGDDNAKIHGRPYYTVGGDGSLYYTYYAPTGGGFIGGIVSALTGGVSDILQGNPMGAALAESGILDGDLGGWLGALTGGATTVIKGIGEGDPLGGIVNSLTNILDNPLVNIADEVFTRMGTGPQQILNWLGVIPDDVYEMNYDWTMKIAHMVGAMYAAGAAEGWLGDLVMPGTFGAIGEAGTGIAATGIGGTEIAGTIARKILINEALKYITGSGVANPESGALGISFNGLSGGEGLAASIKNFPGSVGGSFGFPAKNGLDYVPRDNFMIRAHEGEAVLTKEENKRRRDGNTGNVLHFHFPKALVVDKKAVNELAGLIYPRLEKMAAWGH